MHASATRDSRIHMLMHSSLTMISRQPSRTWTHWSLVALLSLLVCGCDLFSTESSEWELTAPQPLTPAEVQSIEQTIRGRITLSSLGPIEISQIAPTRLRVRLPVSPESAPSFTELLTRKGQVRVAPTGAARTHALSVVLSNVDIRKVALIQPKDRPNEYAIAVELSPDAAARVKVTAASYVGKQLALTIDEQVVTTFTPNAALPSRMQIADVWRGEVGRVTAGQAVNLMKAPPYPMALVARRLPSKQP